MCDLVQGAASSASWFTSPASGSFRARIVAVGSRFLALGAGLALADAAGPFAAAFFAGAFLAPGFAPPGFLGVNLVAMAHPLSASRRPCLPAGSILPVSATRSIEKRWFSARGQAGN